MGIFDFAFGDIKEAYSDVSGFFDDIFGDDSIVKDIAGIAKDLVGDDKKSKSDFSIPSVKVDTSGLDASQIAGAMSGGSALDKYVKANAGAESVDAVDIEQQWLERIREMTVGGTGA